MSNESDELSELDALLQRPQHRKTKSLFNFNQSRKGHHRTRSSLGQLADAFQGSLETISEDFAQEAEVLKRTWNQELHDGAEGRRYFLDMNLTRSLSVLPEAITDFTEEVGITGAEDEAEAPGLRRYVELLTAVLAASSNGTALALLGGVAPPMKLYWRMTATAMVLSPFAIRNLYKDGLPKLSLSQLTTFVGAAVSFFLMTLLLYMALEYTSIGNAVIGANSQALLLIIGKLIMGERVVWMEGGGVLVALAGCVLCSYSEAMEAAEPDDPRNATTALLGDLLAFGSAAAGVAYLTFAKALRPTMAVTTFMFSIMFFGSMLVWSYMVSFGYTVEYNNNPLVGLFGWMNSQHWMILVYVALVCNVMGSMGFVRAMQHFDNLVIAVATLLEPLAATLIAVFVGVGELPGGLGWIGNGLVVLGTVGVVYPSVDKNEGLH